MSSSFLRSALVLSVLGVAAVAGCEPRRAGDGTYEEGRDNPRVNLPEDGRRARDRKGLGMTIDAKDDGSVEGQPGRQEELPLLA